MFINFYENYKLMISKKKFLKLKVTVLSRTSENFNTS